jgi:hypothetical protein
MTKGILAGVALLAATAVGGAAPKPQWVRVGSHHGEPVEVDEASIRTAGGITKGWWRVALAEQRPDGTAQEKQLEVVDCDERLSTSLALVALDAGGQVLSDVREPESAALARLAPATPGTTGELVADAICRLRPRPKPARR